MISLLIISVANHPQLEDDVNAANDVYGKAAENIEHVARGGIKTNVVTLSSRIFALISSIDMAALAASILKISTIQRELATIPGTSTLPPGLTQITPSSYSYPTSSPTQALSERLIINAVGRHFAVIERTSDHELFRVDRANSRFASM